MEPTVYRSSEINEIMADLGKAQGSYKPLIANENSPGGKYANLEAILLAVRESLANNALSFFQHIELLEDGVKLLKTTIGHSSGQYIASCDRIITGVNLRETGNIIETVKRTHAAMLLGIAPSKNDPILFDDNGQELAEQELINRLRKPSTAQKESSIIQKETATVNKDQYDELMIELDGYPEIVKDILECYRIETLADLPREEYHRARKQIMRIKNTYQEYNLKR